MAGACTTLANPWLELPTSAPYVLPEDATAIEAFNRAADVRHRVDLTLLPEPFLGRPDAPVVLLCLNPGWKPWNAALHETPSFARASRASLEHAESPTPFFLLDPELNLPGGGWWRRKLRWPIEEVGLEVVANRVLCVEYFPYHSQRYGSRVPRVPSQDYGFGLVRDAMEREAAIVVMRSARRWEAAIPELASYGHRYHLRNVQNVCISPNNCPDGYAAVINALRSRD